MTSTAPFAHHSEISSVRCGRVPAIQRSRKPKFFIARAAAPTLPASCGSTRITRIFTEGSLDRHAHSDALALQAREEAVVRLGELARVLFERIGCDEIDPSRRSNADARLNHARPLRGRQLFFWREAMHLCVCDDDRMVE